MPTRNAIIPGVDAEVEVHGEMPPLAEQDTARRFSAHDLRDDRDKFGDLANPVIDAFPARLTGQSLQSNPLGELALRLLC